MRGRNKYVPEPMIRRLGIIKQRNNIEKDSEAWEKMSGLIDVGLNVDEFYNTFFGSRRRKK